MAGLPLNRPSPPTEGGPLGRTPLRAPVLAHGSGLWESLASAKERHRPAKPLGPSVAQALSATQEPRPYVMVFQPDWNQGATHPLAHHKHR